jgi:hypothetical protein
MDGKAGVGRPNLKLTNMMQAGKERRLYGLKSAYETVWESSKGLKKLPDGCYRCTPSIVTSTMLLKSNILRGKPSLQFRHTS